MGYIVMSFSWAAQAVKYLRHKRFFFGANNMQINFESMQAGQVVSSRLRRSFLATTSLISFSQGRA